jgi:hypothetical protein
MKYIYTTSENVKDNLEKHGFELLKTFANKSFWVFKFDPERLCYISSDIRSLCVISDQLKIFL